MRSSFLVSVYVIEFHTVEAYSSFGAYSIMMMMVMMMMMIIIIIIVIMPDMSATHFIP